MRSARSTIKVSAWLMHQQQGGSDSQRGDDPFVKRPACNVTCCWHSQVNGISCVTSIKVLPSARFRENIWAMISCTVAKSFQSRQIRQKLKILEDEFHLSATRASSPNADGSTFATCPVATTAGSHWQKIPGRQCQHQRRHHIERTLTPTPTAKQTSAVHGDT